MLAQRRVLSRLALQRRSRRWVVASSSRVASTLVVAEVRKMEVLSWAYPSHYVANLVADYITPTVVSNDQALVILATILFTFASLEHLCGMKSWQMVHVNLVCKNK